MKQFLKKFITLIITSILILSLFGCKKAAKTSSNNTKPMVAVSVVPEATFIKAIAGNLVNIVTMIPPGKSPTNYSPSPQELKKFSDAAIYFTIGVPTEKANILPKSCNINKNVKIVSLADEVAKHYEHRYFIDNDIDIESHETDEDKNHNEICDHSSDHQDYNHEAHHHEGHDPHIWLSPKRAKVMIDVMARELSNIDPQNKDIYYNNAKEYKEKLDNLDVKIKNRLKDLKNKTFIVYHPSFGYFADDYGLTMVSLEKNGKEATAKNIENVIDFAKENNIKVIFYQAEVDSKQSRAFAESLNGETAKIEPLSANYIENLELMAETFSKLLK